MNLFAIVNEKNLLDCSIRFILTILFIVLSFAFSFFLLLGPLVSYSV